MVSIYLGSSLQRTCAHYHIWYNSFIKIDGKIVNFIKAINKGLIFLRDLINKCGKFTKYETICNRFPGPLTWLEYLQLTAAIPKAWLNLDSQPSAKNFDNLCSKPHVVSYVYNELIANWNRDAENAFHRFNKEIDIQWEEYVQGFSNLYLVTNITKYRDFQYRLLLNVIHANNKLFYWKITDSKKCDYCEEAIQTPAHMLYLCPKICTIWHGLEKYVKEYFDLPPNVIEFTLYNVFMSLVYPKASNIVNFLVLVAKQYIYACKCLNENPNVLKIT